MYISVPGECGAGHDPCPPWEACNVHLDYPTCVKINGEFSRKKTTFRLYYSASTVLRQVFITDVTEFSLAIYH